MAPTIMGRPLGNGDGTFQAAYQPGGALRRSNRSCRFQPRRPADIAAGGASLLLGNGDGTFKAPISLVDSGRSVAVGDFNGDGRPDLAIGNAVSVDVFLNITPKR